MNTITYDVRIYKTETYRGKTVTSYTVRWKAGTRPWKEPFRNKAQADSFHAELLAAARRGEAFDLATGRPVSWGRDEDDTDDAPTWYAFACRYAEVKWGTVAPNQRRSIAEALTDATEALLASDSPAAPSRNAIRTALRNWAFSARIRGDTLPDAHAQTVRWIERSTVRVRELVEPGEGAVLVRGVLDRFSRKQDGKAAAANTANRKRMVLNNALEYACEIGALSVNPLKTVKRASPRTAKTVDARVVVNSDQARKLLEAVEEQGERGQRMVAFFGCLYYAALRPEEALALRREHLLSLPERGWGDMHLTHAEPRAGTRWTDNRKARERRELKHRAREEGRHVPIHPELAALLRTHLKRFGTAHDRRLFVGPRGGALAEWAYLEVWREARARVLTKREAASPLARTPYALRHAAVSTWLNAGVSPPQVAEWAGHSVDVLLRVYAKCIAGQEDEAKRRITDATRPRDSAVS